MQYLIDKNNLLHHCITDKDWYIHVVTLYTKQDVKYRLVVKEKTNINVYFMCQTFKCQFRSNINKFNFVWSSKYLYKE